MKSPAGGYAIVLGDLIVDVEPKVLEERLVEGHGLPRARVTMEDHLVDVVHELLVVELGQTVELPGADELQRAAGHGGRF